MMMWFIIILALLVASCINPVEVILAPTTTPVPIPIPIPTPTTRPSPPTPSPTPPPSNALSAQPSEVVCPLCGKPANEDFQFNLRPIAVKVDNAPPARPQSGLSQACIVYEYLAEGGITRLIALYHREAADTVIGPVRSTRMVDIDLIPQYQAIFGFVGSSPRVARALARSGIHDLDEFKNRGAYYRTSSREAPYSTYTSIHRLQQAAVARDWDKPVYVESNVFSPNPPPAALTAAAIAIPYPHSSVEYRYDSERGSYLRFLAREPHIDANEGRQIEVTNVVVQYVRQWATDFVEDAGGAPSLQIEVIGEGKAEVFRDGVAISGRWVQRSPSQRTQYLDEMGKPIPLKPGSTWISLVPTDMEVKNLD